MADAVARFFFSALVRRLVEDAALQTGGQVLLGHPVLAVSVGVEIAGAVAKALAVAAGVFEVSGHLAFAFFFHDRQRVEKGHSRVALGRGGQVQGGVGQWKTPLGQPNAVEGFSRGNDDL